MNYLNKKTVEDIDVSGKKVLVRCDFNVPMKDGAITDTKRIVGALPTVKYLSDHGAKVILCSHMGRPHNIFNETVKLDKKEKKKIDAMPEAEQAEATAKALEAAKGDVKKFSLAPVAAELGKLLGKEVVMASDCIGPDAQAKAAALKDGDVMILENIRFHAEETKNDPDFAKALAIPDHLILTEILAVREENIYGIKTADLAQKVPGSVWFEGFPETADYAIAHAGPGDLLLTLGGGDVYKCANLIVEKYKQRQEAGNDGAGH